MRKRDAALFFGPAAILLTAYAIYNPSGTSRGTERQIVPAQATAHEIRVIDGDTIEWRDVNYRLEGFDAPETRQAECEAERAMGEATSSMLQSIILGATEIDVQVQPGTDRYGRGIARLIVDGTDVGRRLISQGLARAYDGGAREPWCQ